MIEIRRNNDGSLDEIVADYASVHLEQMDDKTWWLKIVSGKKEARLYFTSNRKIKTRTETTGISPA